MRHLKPGASHEEAYTKMTTEYKSFLEPPNYALEIKALRLTISMPNSKKHPSILIPLISTWFYLVLFIIRWIVNAFLTSCQFIAFGSLMMIRVITHGSQSKIDEVSYNNWVIMPLINFWVRASLLYSCLTSLMELWLVALSEGMAT